MGFHTEIIGVNMGKFKPELKEKINALRKEGKTFFEIANILGVTETTLYVWRKRGLINPPDNSSEESERALQEKIDNTIKQLEILFIKRAKENMLSKSGFAGIPTKIRTAISRLDSAEFHLDFVLKRRRGQKKLSKNTIWGIETAIYGLKNARTLLKGCIKTNG